MRNTGLILFISAFLLITCVAYAHPPSQILLNFNPRTKMLTAVIEHYTSNPASHYIKKVDIGVNGKEIKELYFARQEKRESQSFQYELPQIQDHDVISVEGYCSISGKLTQSIPVNLQAR